jgi:hypothetical protein
MHEKYFFSWNHETIDDISREVVQKTQV